MRNFSLVDNFKGYVTKQEPTNTSPEYLIAGSHDVLVDDQAKIVSRRGYKLDGEAVGTETTGVKSSFVWNTSSGTELALRGHTDELEVRYIKQDGSINWLRVANDFTSSEFQFATWWDSSTALDRLLFVNGTANIYEWNGAIMEIASAGSGTLTRKYILEASTISFSNTNPDTILDSANGFVTAGFSAGDIITVSGSASNDGSYTVASVTAGTITLADNNSLTAELAGSSITITNQLGGTWAEARFNTTGTKTVEIDGITYTYTGGETTGTLTGVTPSPSGSVSNGDVAIQSVKTNSNQPASGFLNDTIAVLKNQVYVGSNVSRIVYVSKNSSYTDYTFSSPREVGEGAQLLLDDVTRAFVVEDEQMYISSGKDDWYVTSFTLSADNTKEQLVVEKLKTGSLQGARSQNAVTRIKNNVAFISFEPTLDLLGRVENIDTPQSRPLSDPIKPDFDEMNFIDVHVRYYRDAIYITLPKEGKVYIYDIELGLWQPPQNMYLSRIDVIGGKLYGHSFGTNETYELFADETYLDNGGLYTSKAVLAYRTFGDRTNQKVFDEVYIEGYIAQNTLLEGDVLYDFGGATAESIFNIDGGDSDILFGTSPDASLGKQSLGKNPLGSSVESTDVLTKFRIFKLLKTVPFYELLLTLESTQENSRWEVIAIGFNAKKSSMLDTSRRK